MLNPRDKVLNRHKEAKTIDVMAKTRARHYANERRHAKSSNLELGDKALLKQRKMKKFTTKFQLEPYTVIEGKETQIVAENERHTITRNALFFKKIKEGMRESDEDEIFNRRATMTELNNGTQAPINNQVEKPVKKDKILVFNAGSIDNFFNWQNCHRYVIIPIVSLNLV